MKMKSRPRVPSRTWLIGGAVSRSIPRLRDLKKGAPDTFDTPLSEILALGSMGNSCDSAEDDCDE